MARKRKTKTKTKTTTKTGAGPIYVVSSLDGTPFEGSCTCPVCAALERQGTSGYRLTASGALRKIRPAPPAPSISVHVEPTLSTAPFVGTRPFVEQVPEGCVTWDFLEYLRFTRAELRSSFEPGALSLRRERSRLAGDDVLRDGDVVSLAANQRD